MLGYRTGGVSEHIDYFRTIGVSRVGRVIELAPSLLGMSLELLASKVGYYESLGIDASKLLTSHPTIFTLSLEDNIVPTVSFLQDEIVEALREIERNPSLLSLS